MTTAQIYEIQGGQHVSPYVGQMVTIPDDVVTVVRSNGFYLQHVGAYDNVRSNGIFVFTYTGPSVAVGDRVTVTGRVSETRVFDSDCGVTEIDLRASGASYTVLSSGNALPGCIVIGSGGRQPPAAVIKAGASGNGETSGGFAPSTNGLDFYESLEGMRVQVNNAVVVGPTKTDVIAILPDGGSWASVRTARGGIIARASDFNPERILIDSDLLQGTLPLCDVGDTFSAPLIGVVGYLNGNYRLHLTSLPVRVAGGLSPQTAGSAGAALSIATFNVHGLSAGQSASVFDGLAAVIVNDLASPDLISLEEIQDNSGTADSGTTAATATMAKLILAISNAGGPAYGYRQIDPANNADGGEFAGNIRIVFLFRTDRGLAFVDRPSLLPAVSSATAGAARGASVRLSRSPGRIAPTNSAWVDVRKPLVGELLWGNARLFVVGCHLKSKVGDDPLFGRYQPPSEATAAQRAAEAVLIADFAASLLLIDANAKIIVLGDLNDFEWSTPLSTLKAAGFHSLVEGLDADDRYTFNDAGNSQALDHMLISNWLYANASPQFAVNHCNVEFAAQVSDHDPLLLRLTI